MHKGGMRFSNWSCHCDQKQLTACRHQVLVGGPSEDSEKVQNIEEQILIGWRRRGDHEAIGPDCSVHVKWFLDHNVPEFVVEVQRDDGFLSH
jgi:hypothetical protein